MLNMEPFKTMNKVQAEVKQQKILAPNSTNPRLMSELGDIVWAYAQILILWNNSVNSKRHSFRAIELSHQNTSNLKRLTH